MKAAMDANGDLTLQAMCGRCHTAFSVDLDAMIWRFGRDFSLVNQHGRCKRMGCGGRTVFQFSSHPSMPFQTMTDKG